MQIFVPYYIFFFIFYIIISARKSQISIGITNVFLVFFLSLYIILVGFRDFDFKGDTQTYLTLYNSLRYTDYTGRLEQGFLLVLKFFSYLDLSERQLLFSLVTIQASLWYAFTLYFFDDNRKRILFVMLLVSSFFIYNTGTNVLRQGFAIPLSLLSVTFLINKRWLLSFLFLCIAINFHSSSIVVILTYVLAKKINISLFYYLVVLLIFTMLSFLGLFEFFNSIFYSTFSQHDHLFTNSAFEIYKIGFRFDFWLFSLPPLILYLFLTDKGKDTNIFFIKQYVILFCGFIFLFSFPYSDRFGLYLWTMMLILVSNYSFNYRIKFGNENIVTALLILLYGVIGFILNPLMDFNYYL